MLIHQTPSSRPCWSSQSGTVGFPSFKEPGAFIFLINFPMSQPPGTLREAAVWLLIFVSFLSPLPQVLALLVEPHPVPPSTVGEHLPRYLPEQSHSCTWPLRPVFLPGPHPLCPGAKGQPAHCAPDNSTAVGAATRAMCSPRVVPPRGGRVPGELSGAGDGPAGPELKYLLQKDSRIEVHSIFISNDMRLGSWFDSPGGSACCLPSRATSTSLGWCT